MAGCSGLPPNTTVVLTALTYRQAEACDIVAGCSGLSPNTKVVLTALTYRQAEACDIVAGCSGLSPNTTVALTACNTVNKFILLVVLTKFGVILKISKYMKALQSCRDTQIAL